MKEPEITLCCFFFFLGKDKLLPPLTTPAHILWQFWADLVFGLAVASPQAAHVGVLT